MKGIYLFIFLIIAISLNSQAIYENSVVYPVYDGDDLGVLWKGDEVNINVWAPTLLMFLFNSIKMVMEVIH